MKYQRFAPLGCKDIGFGKFEIVTKAQLLCDTIFYVIHKKTSEIKVLINRKNLLSFYLFLKHNFAHLFQGIKYYTFCFQQLL